MERLRMYLAEKLLNLVSDIAPHNQEGKALKIHIFRYTELQKRR